MIHNLKFLADLVDLFVSGSSSSSSWPRLSLRGASYLGGIHSLQSWFLIKPNIEEDEEQKNLEKAMEESKIQAEREEEIRKQQEAAAEHAAKEQATDQKASDMLWAD